MTFSNISFLTLFIGFICFSSTISAQKTNQILEEVQQRSEQITSEEATLKMEIMNEAGQTRSRTIKSFQKISNDVVKTLVYFKAPASVEGTALLTIREDGDQVQKLYLPTVSRIQTITGSQRNQSFMGSDFTYEDLGQFNEGDYTSELIDSTESAYNIEAIPTGESGYDRIVFSIDRNRYVVLNARYFRNDTHVKTLTASDFENVTDNVWSPSQMVMEDLTDGGKTVLRWENRTINADVDDRLFTERMLKRGL